jgi:hypothetical protein
VGCRHKHTAIFMKTLTKTRRYNLSEELINKLDQLKQYNIVESRFVRIAIEEKLQRDIPKLKTESETFHYPF